MIKSISNTHQLGSISSTCDLIDAKLEEHQLAGGSNLQCPCCGHKLERKPDWVGLPAGVKFDPTDQELIEHLEAKVVLANIESKSHPLIDEFIPTIEGEDGICYTHPEKLPGVTRDGLNRHFFHRPSKAYTTGTRKRRKIQTECDDLQGGETRWHKTGKTRPVIVNGKQKGCKKILVLYKNFGKNRKPEKTNWVMHQYHLGHHEEETEGELVVSKIFYQTQPRQCSSKEMNIPCHGDELSVAVCGAMSSYNTMDIQQLKADNFGFLPFEKSSEAGIIVADDKISTTALHISRPSSSISAIMDQPTLHHTSVVLEKDSFHVPGIILPHEHFQKQQQQYQQQHQLEERSASGLEELIMGCTSTDREEPSISNPQEADWLKYSPFWHDPNNSDHHR